MRFKAAMRTAAEEAAKAPAAPADGEVAAVEGNDGGVMDEEGEEEEPKTADQEIAFDAD